MKGGISSLRVRKISAGGWLEKFKADNRIKQTRVDRFRREWEPLDSTVLDRRVWIGLHIETWRRYCFRRPLLSIYWIPKNAT
jgi:hypothetical protein